MPEQDDDTEAEWLKNWQKIVKHRKATAASWKNGNAKNRSQADESAAQYNPLCFHTDEEVRAIELKCINEGILIRESAMKRTYYLYVSDNYVGYCCGNLTKYVFAEWLKSDGAIHGRPICEKTLMKKGVNL